MNTDEFFKSPKKIGQGVCPQCRKRPTAICLQVLVREGRTPKTYTGRSRSRSRSLCFECGRDMFDHFTNQLNFEDPAESA